MVLQPEPTRDVGWHHDLQTQRIQNARQMKQAKCNAECYLWWIVSYCEPEACHYLEKV